MKGPCLNPEAYCEFSGQARRSIGHHVYHPKRDFPTPLEKAFRNLPQNILQRCVCEELEYHQQYDCGPPKPSLVEMIIACTVKFED
jgi:hypothetical protein